MIFRIKLPKFQKTREIYERICELERLFDEHDDSIIDIKKSIAQIKRQITLIKKSKK